MTEQDIISFAYLFKQLSFSAKFERRKKGFKFNGKNVESFYAKEKEQKKQITVYRYNDQNNFLISIPDKSAKDSIFFLKTGKSMTVDEVINEVIKNEGKGAPMLKDDLFEMPVIELDCQRDYKEMIGLPFKNESLQNYFLAVMMEALKLKIDESGAKVESMAVMIATKCAMINMNQPR